MQRMQRGCRGLVLVVGVLSVVTPHRSQAADHPRAARCPGGRFVLSAPLAPSKGAPRIGAVVIDDDGVALDGACGATKARVTTEGAATRVRAAWRKRHTCVAIPGRVSFVGIVAGPECNALAGIVVVRTVGKRRRLEVAGRRAAAVTVGTAQVGTPAWTEQGPGPDIVPSFLGYSRITGAVEVIAPDPSDPDRVFVGAANGGIWRTANATAADPTWVPLTDGERSLSMGALAFDPLDTTSKTLYAGFGPVSRGAPQNGGASGPLPGVLLKTTDGGDTWTELAVPAFAGEWIRRILPTRIVTAQGQVLLVATGSGLYRSGDGGQSWTLALGGGAAFDVVEHPSMPSRLFAGRGGVFRSDDGGVTWTPLAGGLPGGLAFGIINLAISPTADAMGRHWLFAMIHGGGGGVYVSTDDGTTWTAMDQPPDGSNFGGTFQGTTQIAVSPQTPSVVFAAGDAPSWWRGDAEAAAGSQWFALSGANTGNTAPHTDSRNWAFSADPTVLFESDDGGIYRLKDAGSAAPVWESAIGSLRVTEFLSVAYDSVNDVVFGAAWDNSIPAQTTPDDIAWGTNERFSSDGNQVGVDNTTTPGVSVHYSSQQLLFQAQRASVAGGMTTTVDLGLDIAVGGGMFLHYNFLEGNIFEGNDNDLGTVRFIQSWAVNQEDGARVLIGTDYLYESFDRADHLTSLGGIGANAVTGLPIPLNPVGTVTAYAYGHPSDADVFFVGTAGNRGARLWRRASGTGSPTPVPTYDAVGDVPYDIAMSPSDARRAYVADARGRVWQTTDGGDGPGWLDLDGDVSAPLHALTTDLRTIETYASAASPAKDVVLAGGFGGVFVTRNPGPRAVWRRFGELPNAIVTDLHYDRVDDVLVAGIYGRGAWKMKAAGAELTFDEPPICDAGGLYSTECTGTTGVLLDGGASIDPNGEPLSYTWTGPFAGGSASGQSPLLQFAGPGTFTVTLQVSDGTQTSTCDAVVEITDSVSPSLGVTLSPRELWPPNHRLVNVDATIDVHDACDPAPAVTLVGIESNEPDDAEGDGHTSPDVVGALAGTDDRSFALRTERSGTGSGRTYTVTYAVTDGSGNVSRQSPTVVVPHGRGGK